jgi:hypothetical protein
MRIKTFILFLIVYSFWSETLRGQTFSDKLYFTFQPEWGTLVAHHEELKALDLYDFPNFELNIYRQATGVAEWEKRWNYPQSGVSLYYSALCNKKVFGEAYAIMPFESFTFFRRPKHEQRLMIAFGLGYLTHPYDGTTNPENIAIGCHVNAAVKFQYSFLYRFTPNIGLALGTSFGHFSNGALKYPNWGLNVWAFSAGLHVKFNQNPIALVQPPVLDFHKKWIPYAWGAWGTKQNTESDPKLYNATSFGGGIARNYKYGKEWMAGLDVFWDYTDKIEFSHKQEFPNNFQLFKWGLYGGHEWSMNRFSAVFQTGLYLYQYSYFSKRKTDAIYSRVAFRYKIIDGLQANVSIKSHFARADYIEWGLVYKFRH